jgi:glutamate racemase
MNKPIGVFDSGVGGLTVLKELRRQLPREDIVYLGDTAHVPYGGKSRDTICRLTVNNILFLLSKRVKAVVVACNSASSVALPEIRDYFTVPVLGVVEAGVESALATGFRRIGIIGTKATIRSRAYQSLLEKADRSLALKAESCPLFVPLVEEGWAASVTARDVAREYLKDFNGKVDTLILGCTHYPLLKRVISGILPQVKLIDSAVAVAQQTRAMLVDRGLLSTRKKNGKTSYFLTDDSPVFYDLVKAIMKEDVKPVITDHV